MDFLEFIFPRGAEKREIEKEPAFSELHFGDGMTALLLAVSDGGYDDNGLDMVKVTFEPTEGLVDKYDIRYTDYDRDTDEYQITKYYPRIYFRTLSVDPAYGRCMLLCCYDGSPGPLIKEKEHLFETIKFQQRKITALKANVALAQQEMDETLNQAEKRDKRTMKRIQNIRGKVDRNVDMVSYGKPPSEGNWKSTEYYPEDGR